MPMSSQLLTGRLQLDGRAECRLRPLGTRFQARIRDINFQTVSLNGTKSKDTFATIVQTARKLKVNFYQYVYDRVTKKCEMPSLAELIFLKAQQVQGAT